MSRFAKIPEDKAFLLEEEQSIVESQSEHSEEERELKLVELQSQVRTLLVGGWTHAGRCHGYRAWLFDV